MLYLISLISLSFFKPLKDKYCISFVLTNTNLEHTHGLKISEIEKLSDLVYDPDMSVINYEDLY